MAVSYETIKDISEPRAIGELVATRVIAPVLPSVQVAKVRAKEGRRFEAPRVLWNVYEMTLELPGGFEARKLFWTKAFFDDQECERYRSRVARLLSTGGQNPLDPGGSGHFFPDLNMFLFFFPTDPVFPAFARFFDADQALPILTPHLDRKSVV